MCFAFEKGRTRGNREYRPKTAKNKGTPQHQGTAFLHALRQEPFPPTCEGKTPARQRWNALRQLPANVRKNSSPVREFSALTAARQGHSLPPPLAADAAYRGREGDPGRPEGGRSAASARTSPRPQAGEGSRRCPLRHAADGVQPNSRDKFRVPAQRGARWWSIEGIFPTHPMPRAGQQPRCTERHQLTTTRAFYLFSKVKRSNRTRPARAPA